QSALRSFAIPLCCLRGILLNAVAFVIHPAKVKLGLSIAFLSFRSDFVHVGLRIDSLLLAFANERKAGQRQDDHEWAKMRRRGIRDANSSTPCQIIHGHSRGKEHEVSLS